MRWHALFLPLSLYHKIFGIFVANATFELPVIESLVLDITYKLYDSVTNVTRVLYSIFFDSATRNVKICLKCKK